MQTRADDRLKLNARIAVQTNRVGSVPRVALFEPPSEIGRCAEVSREEAQEKNLAWARAGPKLVIE
jgi:hypothetical protein